MCRLNSGVKIKASKQNKIFKRRKSKIEAQGEYYFESEMEKTKTLLLPEVQEPVQEQDSTQASPEEQPASPDPTEAQETLGSHKKNRK